MRFACILLPLKYLLLALKCLLLLTFTVTIEQIWASAAFYSLKIVFCKWRLILQSSKFALHLRSNSSKITFANVIINRLTWVLLLNQLAQYFYTTKTARKTSFNSNSIKFCRCNTKLKKLRNLYEYVPKNGIIAQIC